MLLLTSNSSIKYFIALSIIISLATKSYSQSDPVPSYVTTQYFPDSVRALAMYTLDGKTTTFGAMLDSYKGKKILIDVWASWCRDCIIGYPKLEQLRKEIGEENVAYVFLSTDKDEQKWKNAITRFNIRGDHYLLEGAWKNALANYLVLDWVPRYLVLDKTGMVIMPKAINADDVGLRKALK